MNEGGQFEKLGKVLNHSLSTLAQTQTMALNIPNSKKLKIFATFELNFLELCKNHKEWIKTK